MKNDFYDKMTNDKMTKWRFEALPQRAKMAHRGSERVASPAVEGISDVAPENLRL